MTKKKSVLEKTQNGNGKAIKQLLLLVELTVRGEMLLLQSRIVCAVVLLVVGTTWLGIVYENEQLINMTFSSYHLYTTGKTLILSFPATPASMTIFFHIKLFIRSFVIKLLGLGQLNLHDPMIL